MIQRIQTLYLLIVTVISELMMFFPFHTVVTDNLDTYTLSFKGFAPVEATGFNLTFTTVWLSILVAVIPLISLITIFLYKHRILQIRLSIFNMILMAGFYAMFFFVKYNILKGLSINEQTMGWPVIVPFISVMLTYLAVRAIGKDEALVQSLNRLR